MIVNIAVLCKVLGAGICLTSLPRIPFSFSFICIASTIYIPKLNSQDEPQTNITGGGGMDHFYDWIESVGGLMTWQALKSYFFYYILIFWYYIKNTQVSCLFSMVKTLPNTMVWNMELCAFSPFFAKIQFLFCSIAAFPVSSCACVLALYLLLFQI